MVLVQGLVGLGDDVVFLFVRGHVADLVRDALGGLVHAAVGRLDEAVAVDAGVGRQRADQADVRSFRRLDGAQARVVRVVNVAHVHGGAVAVEAARAQGRGAALVGQLRQGVGLVQELGELRGAEELLDRRGDRADVDEGLRGHHVQIRDRHALLDRALQAGKADADLVLQKLAHRAQAAVAQVVDVVDGADAVVEADDVAHGGHDVVDVDVLGDQVVDVLADGGLEALLVLVFRHQGAQRRDVDLLGDADLLRVEGEEGRGVGEVVAQHLDVKGAPLVFHVQGHAVDAGVLDGLGHLAGDGGPGGDEDLARLGVDHVLGRDAARDARGQRQLLVELIAADLGQVVSLGVEEQAVDQGIGRLHRRRLAGAQLLVDLEQTGVHALCGVALDGGQQVLLAAQKLEDLVVRAVAQRAQEHGHGQLARAVDAHPHHVVGVRLVLEPGAAAGDDGRGVEGLAGLVDGLGVVDAGRADELGDDDALGAVDDEGARGGHQREVAHEDLLLLDLARLLVHQAHVHAQGRGVGIVPLLAALLRVLGRLIEGVVRKLQHQVFRKVGNGRNVPEHLAEIFLQKAFVGVLLHLDQVGHFQDFFDLGKTHPRALSHLNRMDHVSTHLSCRFPFAGLRRPPRVACKGVCRRVFLIFRQGRKKALQFGRKRCTILHDIGSEGCGDALFRIMQIIIVSLQPSTVNSAGSFFVPNFRGVLLKI